MYCLLRLLLQEEEEDGSSGRRKRQSGVGNVDPYGFSAAKTRCPLLLVADYRFFREMGGGSTKSTINYLVPAVDCFGIRTFFFVTTLDVTLCGIDRSAWSTGSTRSTRPPCGRTASARRRRAAAAVTRRRCPVSASSSRRSSSTPR